MEEGAVTPKRAFVIFCFSASSLHHSWNNLLQNMIYLFFTLLRRDLYLPELLYTVYKLLLVVKFYFWLQVELEFTPQGFHGLKIRTLHREYATSWFFTPRRELVLHVCFRSLSFMKWCTELYFQLTEQATSLEHCKWDQHPRCHQRCKSWRHHVYWFSLHMNFERMLRFQLALSGFVLSSEARTTIRLEGDRALDAENPLDVRRKCFRKKVVRKRVVTLNFSCTRLLAQT